MSDGHGRDGYVPSPSLASTRRASLYGAALSRVDRLLGLLQSATTSPSSSALWGSAPSTPAAQPLASAVTTLSRQPPPPSQPSQQSPPPGTTTAMMPRGDTVHGGTEAPPTALLSSPYAVAAQRAHAAPPPVAVGHTHDAGGRAVVATPHGDGDSGAVAPKLAVPPTAAASAATVPEASAPHAEPQQLADTPSHGVLFVRWQPQPPPQPQVDPVFVPWQAMRARLLRYLRRVREEAVAEERRWSDAIAAATQREAVLTREAAAALEREAAAVRDAQAARQTAARLAADLRESVAATSAANKAASDATARAKANEAALSSAKSQLAAANAAAASALQTAAAAQAAAAALVAEAAGALPAAASSDEESSSHSTAAAAAAALLGGAGRRGIAVSKSGPAATRRPRSLADRLRHSDRISERSLFSPRTLQRATGIPQYVVSFDLRDPACTASLESPTLTAAARPAGNAARATSAPRSRVKPLMLPGAELPGGTMSADASQAPAPVVAQPRASRSTGRAPAPLGAHAPAAFGQRAPFAPTGAGGLASPSPIPAWPQVQQQPQAKPQPRPQSLWQQQQQQQQQQQARVGVEPMVSASTTLDSHAWGPSRVPTVPVFASASVPSAPVGGEPVQYSPHDVQQAIACFYHDASPKYEPMLLNAVATFMHSTPDVPVGVLSHNPSQTIDVFREAQLPLERVHVRHVQREPHFEQWNPTQYKLDIAQFAPEYKVVAWLDSDTLTMRDLRPLLVDFAHSTDSVLCVPDLVLQDASFAGRWSGNRDAPFVPQASFMLFKSDVLPLVTRRWEERWREWIEPHVFATYEDPMPGMPSSAFCSEQYALGMVLEELSAAGFVHLRRLSRREFILGAPSWWSQVKEFLGAERGRGGGSWSGGAGGDRDAPDELVELVGTDGSVVAVVEPGRGRLWTAWQATLDRWGTGGAVSSAPSSLWAMTSLSTSMRMLSSVASLRALARMSASSGELLQAGRRGRLSSGWLVSSGVRTVLSSAQLAQRRSGAESGIAWSSAVVTRAGRVVSESGDAVATDAMRSVAGGGAAAHVVREDVLHASERRDVTGTGGSGGDDVVGVDDAYEWQEVEPPVARMIDCYEGAVLHLYSLDYPQTLRTVVQDWDAIVSQLRRLTLPAGTVAVPRRASRDA